MSYRYKMIIGLIGAAILSVLFFPAPVLAKSTSAVASKGQSQRYIVVLDDPPLVAYDGRVILTPERDQKKTQLAPTANSFTGKSKINVKSKDSEQYLQFLDDRLKSFRGEALLRLGRQLATVHRYHNVLNGFATDLTLAEAKALREMTSVRAVVFDEIQHVGTDTGPIWIGADTIHDGSAGVAATGGEGVVIGVIDLGVNWEHPSFQDPGESGSGYDHANPYGFQLGLCSDAEVLCNDKLVGVYDFVTDDPDTDFVEENTKGKDNDGHGSHTASTAAGNPLDTTINGVSAHITGVAPNANLITYRVCYIGDPGDPDDDGCASSAILSAIDQAVADGVDVINYSLGGNAFDPWIPGTASFAFLSARSAGIFVATSAGNSGPNGGTVGNPANAPWITSVGNATHDRVFANALENLSGGSTTPPDDLIGASFSGGTGVRTIVHAKDFGNALCGTGTPELQPDCDGNTGATNPFASGTFSGEIVVCDRGNYGRVEKGKNVMLAGAGGYVLANTVAQGETVVADMHCLPATHLGANAGDELRAWLDGVGSQQGSLSGFSLFHITEVGDMVSSSSARGPNLPPVEDIPKPEIIAPGTDILAAWSEGENSYNIISGTSMSSPHAAGSGALLKAVHPDWSPAAIASVLTMTATPEQALDFDGSTPTSFVRGGGRIQLDKAVNAGLSLEVTHSEFMAADPEFGGVPKDLNLAGLVYTDCVNHCEFLRTVTDLAGGASWTASAEGLSPGASVSISPSSFSLASGAKQPLTIRVDVSASGLLGTWIYGNIRLTSSGHPDAVLSLAVFAASGNLPSQWDISTNTSSGWEEFALSNLVAMPDATYTSGGLTLPTETVEDLPQDPTRDDPYDNPAFVMTVLHEVPADTLLFHTETLDSSAVDLDLYVGLDSNGNGMAEQSEELCSSTTETAIELCDLLSPVAGDYWIVVQNWDATLDPDEVTLISAVVVDDSSSTLTVTGGGVIPAGASHKLRLSWDNVNAVPGKTLFGAVGLGSDREKPNNLGVIPVNFTKTAVALPDTLVMMNGISRGLTLAASGTHDRLFIDIPPGTTSLTIAAVGADTTQSENLIIDLYRQAFDDAFASAPFVTVPDTSGSPLVSASGSSGNGPLTTVSAPEPGRWFALLKNDRGQPAAVSVQADLVFSDDQIPLRAGLWEASSRPNIRQGFDYITTGGARAFVWYTYHENGQPAWYLAAAAEQSGNVWVAPLSRYTNDGSEQQSVLVGHVSVTLLAEDDSIFSFVLFGEDGSDREFPSFSPSCPTVNASQTSYSGHYARPVAGLGGATVVANVSTEGELHYVYDDMGNPAWLLGATATENIPGEQELPLSQYSGFCAVCSGPEPTPETVGVLTREYIDEDNMNWNLNYVLNAPLSGSQDRSDNVIKLTLTQACP